eukprot:TRINITY_DN29490_c0_g1_i2.p1 TRINITY_DN29490_c0_g1~~TRINITY_DN29490_c0_g1_i2.p1  ORF type:complete len:253 (+),score=39.93 TRINITY_DN29490_c0_g1_i2:162-920(+)
MALLTSSLPASFYTKSVPFKRLPTSLFSTQCHSWLPVSHSVFLSPCLTTGVQLRGSAITKANLSDLARDRITEIDSTNSIKEDLLENTVDPQEVIVHERQEKDGSILKIVFNIGKGVTVGDVQDLYDKVGWDKTPRAVLAKSLKNSYMIATLHVMKELPNKDSMDEHPLIGMARAASDHAFNAVICDVIIDPMFQGHGLGKILLEETIRALKNKDINVITLFSAGSAIGFYKKLGFEVDPEGIKGMCWSHRI